ncbi:DUF1150 family protein [Rhodobacteraceae bacterium]|nr:DUF1150 family protein [Paracoccaceae bacterium]
MESKFDFQNDPQDRIVYIRSVEAQDLPDDVQAELGGLKQLYAVHSSDGERLALVRDRDMAFMLARQNDYAPVAVH